MDRDKEILVPFELFTTYMQHVCRALAIRLLMPDLAECIARKDQHGRLATALVSSIPFPTTLTCLQGGSGPRRKIRSCYRDSEEVHVCGCVYSLPQAQSGCGV